MLGKEKGLRFSMGSVEYLDRVKNHTWEILRERAASKALSENRNVVTEDDVRACLDDALQAVVRDEAGTASVGR